MNKDIEKNKEQLLAELEELRRINKEQEEKITLQNKEFEDKFLQRTKEFKKSEHNYKMLFNESPVPTWEEDFSQCKTYIDSLKKRNIKNFREYFEKNIDEVIDLSKKVKIIDINKAALKLHEAYSKLDLLHSLSSIFTDKSYKTFTEQLICIAEGKKEYESEAIVKTIAGLEKKILLKWVVVPGYENTLEKVYVTTTDITKRKQVEEALNESEDRLSKTMMAANDGMWDWDLKSNRVFFDARYYQMAGYDVDEFPHQLEEFQKRVHKEDVDYVMNEAQKHLEGKIDRFIVEFRFKKKNSDWLWVRGRGLVVERDENNAPLRFIGAHTDVTERKQAEEKLKESEEFLSSIFNNSLNSIMVADDLGNYISVNQAAANMFGYTVEEMHKMNVGQLNTTTDPDAAEKYKIYIEKGHEIGEFPFVHTNGEERIAQYHAVRVRDNFNLSILSDITDRKKAEIALKESEQKFQKIINESFDGIFVTNEEGKIIIWNNALEKITGIKKAQTIDQYIWDVQVDLLDHEETNTKRKEEVKSFLLDILKTGKAPWLNLTMERVYIHPDGTVKIESGSMYTIKTQKGYLVVSVSNDITDRKLAEEKLKENEELFSKAFRSSPIAITITDQNTGKFVQVNRAWSRIYEYTEEEVIGKTAEELQIVDKKTRLQIIDELKTKGNLINVEMQLRNKSGIYRWILFSTESIVLGGVPCVLSTGIDVTDRKKAEEAYKETHSNLQALLDNRRDSIWALDNNYNYLVYNKPYADVIYSNMGIRLKKGMNAFDIHPKEVNDFWKPKFDEVLKGEYVTFEFSHVLDGEELFFEVYMNPIYTDNKVSGLSALSMDITKRKRAEKELIKLSTSVTQSPSIILIAGVEGNIEYVNPKFTEITEYSQEEVTGKNPRIFKSGEHAKEMYKKLWKTISSGKTWRGEFHDKKKNGQLFWEMASISPIFDVQGKIINYIKVSEDITAKKKTEQELTKAKEKAEESEYKIRSMFENTQIGILYCNAQGKILEANQVMLDILGSPSIEATLKINLLTFKPLQDNGFAQNVEKCISEKIVVSEDTVYTTKWGKTVFMKYYLVPVILNEKVIGVWANLNNLTDLWNTQNELKNAKEKAEESDRLKSAFLANMSHEIRTPMNGILGFTQLLKKPQLTGDKKERYIYIIEKSGERMLNTINDIIDISKIEAGQVEVVNSEISVNSFLDEQFNFFQIEAKSKGLDLKYKPSLTNNEARIITDQHKLEGILINLLKNAIKFTKTGEIVFGYNLKDKTEGKFIEFYVKDTGIGIPANRLEAIFNRFEQADIADTQVFEGSGLGLAISKSYVEMLGGEIEVNSKAGSGSTFTFSIPYNTKSSEEKNLDRNSKEKIDVIMNNLSIIIAEDDENSRLFLETILENYAKSIEFAITGKEVIEKIREKPETDVILMDIKMPEMNGYDATREIRKFNNDVIIIAQTAFGLSGDNEKALEAGCDDHISKPIDEEILFEKIRTCLMNRNI